MAHSIQVFDQKAETFNDLDLLALIKLFLRELNGNSAAYHQLRPIVAVWQEALRQYGPGTIDLDLERIASDAEGRRQFADLLTAVGRKLDQYGGFIPAADLNSHYPIPGVTFSDYQKKLLLEAIGKVNKLLARTGM